MVTSAKSPLFGTSSHLAHLNRITIFVETLRLCFLPADIHITVKEVILIDQEPLVSTKIAAVACVTLRLHTLCVHSKVISTDDLRVNLALTALATMTALSLTPDTKPLGAKTVLFVIIWNIHDLLPHQHAVLGLIAISCGELHGQILVCRLHIRRSRGFENVLRGLLRRGKTSKLLHETAPLRPICHFLRIFDLAGHHAVHVPTSLTRFIFNGYRDASAGAT